MKIIKKVIIVFLQLLIIIMLILFDFLIFDNEIKKYKKDKSLFFQDISKLKNNISDIERDILDVFLSNLKNDYVKRIDNVCRNSKDEFEICIINNVINDFKKQDNYSVLKRGKIEMKVPLFGLYQLKVMNLIFKNKEIIFDESCSESKTIVTQHIHVVKRDILNTKTGEIHEFSSSADCHDMNAQWFQNSISKPEEYEKKIGRLPGDFLLYEMNRFNTKKYYFDGKFLNVVFKLFDDSARKYKQYIKFISNFDSGFNPDSQIKFSYIDINFKINITDYKINEINTIDNYRVKIMGLSGEVTNTFDMFFFYNKTLVGVNETDKINYFAINCSDYCNNFKINEN